MRTAVAILLLSAGLSIRAFGQDPAKSAPAKASSAKQPSGAAVPAAVGGATPVSAQGAALDRQIETKIRAKLATSKIGKDGFTVRVQGGVAYWEGTTNVVQHKGSATRMAKSAGAKRVVNNIKITEAAKEKATENLDQGRRRAQIKRSEPRSSPEH
jgi:osmotically-inducible protein OsmY